MKFLKKFFMKRIDSIDKLTDLGRRVFKNNLQYTITYEDNDYIFEIYRDGEKIFDFVCTKKLGQMFLDEAIPF